MSLNPTIRVWDIEARCCLRSFLGHGSIIYGLALDPAGRRLASGSDDNTVRLWDLDSGTCLRTIVGRSLGFAKNVVWDWSGALIASGSSDDNVYVWEAASGALRHTLAGHSEQVHALAAHPTDDLLASGSADKTVRVWRWSSGALVRTLAGHWGYVASLAASAEWLVSGSWDATVRVWSWTSGACARVLDGFAGGLERSSLSWRGSMLVTLEWAVSEGTVRVWDASSVDPREWSCVGSLASKASTYGGVALAVDGSVACAAPDDKKTIALWDL